MEKSTHETKLLLKKKLNKKNRPSKYNCFFAYLVVKRTEQVTSFRKQTTIVRGNG